MTQFIFAEQKKKDKDELNKYSILVVISDFIEFCACGNSHIHLFIGNMQIYFLLVFPFFSTLLSFVQYSLIKFYFYVNVQHNNN